MRKTIIFLLISIGVNAQFNYQALIKHSSGQIISNNQVKVKFTLMYGTSSVSPVYEEEHIVNIPADGVVNLSVGGGTVVNGTFSNIDWSQSVFMKEELDTGNGYQDMGTKQLTTVPYAEYSSGVQGVNLTGENVAVGNYAMQNKDFTTSAGNIAIGEYALQTRTTEISNGSVNVAIGYNALKDNRSGDDNVAINKGALEKNNDGNNNIAIGTNSINKNINGGYNIAIGQYSLESSIAASQSIAIGYQAMQYFNNGGEVVNSSNTAIGVYALRGESSTSSNTGGGNTAIGSSSLKTNTIGINNTAVGDSSLKINTSGGYNTAIGKNSMDNNDSGRGNTALGYESLRANTEGNYNVALGYGSGWENTVGDKLTLIGYNSGTNGESDLFNSVAIGAEATVTSSNTIQLGNTDVTLVNTAGVVSAAGLNIGGTAITSTASELNLLDGLSEIGVLASISENNNTGVRLSSSNSSNHGDIGGDAVDLSKQGQSSSIRGATGYGSFASGYNTTASESYSTALGSYTVASGYGSTATGRYTTASGYYSVTMGHSTTASDWGSLVIGRYNLSSSSATSADSFSTSNPAFVIGNGSASSARSDAFKVMYNGDTTTSGIVSATGFKGSGDQLTLNDNGTITSLMQLIGDLKSEISALQQSNNSEIKSAQVKTNTSNDVVLFELGVLRFSWNTTYNTIQVKQSSSSEIVDNWFISGVIRSGGSSGEYSPNETYIQKSNMTYGLGDGGGYNDRFTPIWSDGFTSLMEGSIALGSTYSNFEFYITPMGSGSSTQYDPVPTWQLRGHVDGYGQLTVTCIHAKFDGNSGW